MAMQYYFNTPPKTKRFPGRKRATLPVILNEDIKEGVQFNNIPITKFENSDDLNTLKSLASGRDKWKRFSSI